MKCEGTGRFELVTCPKVFVSGDIWEAMEMAELYEKGLPPVAGGALDQTRSFLEACRFIWRDQCYWKNKLGMMNLGV